MNSVHLVDCKSYDVSVKCQNFLYSKSIWDNYFWTEGVHVNAYCTTAVDPDSSSRAGTATVLRDNSTPSTRHKCSHHSSSHDSESGWTMVINKHSRLGNGTLPYHAGTWHEDKESKDGQEWIDQYPIHCNCGNLTFGYELLLTIPDVIWNCYGAFESLVNVMCVAIATVNESKTRLGIGGLV